MDEDLGFSGRQLLRLFPLPGVVLFPKAILPLHIFEPRYKQMTEDALASDGLVTIVMIRTPAGGIVKGSPALEEYGCVGRILKYERLTDGRFNFLLLGLRRVRLVREVPSGAPYRTAEAEPVDDLVIEDDALSLLVSDLIGLFRAFLDAHGGIDPDLDTIVSSPLPSGTLADILAHALPLPVAMKQELLAERQVEIRLDILSAWLRSAAHPAPGFPSADQFPPPFSAN